MNAFEKIKEFVKLKFDYCAEQSLMNLDAECGSEIASYFRERKELYLDRANIYGEVMREIDRIEAELGKEGCTLCYLGSPCEYQNKDIRVQITNADRIRAMSDEELAEYFSELIKDTKKNDYCEYACDWLEWLKSLYDKEPET